MRRPKVQAIASAGGLVGIEANGDLIVADMFSEQLDSGARVGKQKDIAHEDGHSVTVVIPEDKGASGKDVVFFMQQQLEGFNVVARPVTNASSGLDGQASTCTQPERDGEYRPRAVRAG
jgi:hypothetical protein